MKILILFSLTFNLLHGSIWSLPIKWFKGTFSAKSGSTVVIAGTASGSSDTTELEEISLRPKWHEQFQFAGYYMAQKKGYYKDEGLKVNILSYNKNLNITNEVIAGRATYGIGHSSLVIDILNAKKIILLKALLQDSPIRILSLKKNELKNNKNARIMVSKEESQGLVFQLIIKNQGLELTDLTFLYESPKVSDLINNKTDFMIAYQSNEPQILKNNHIAYNSISLKKHKGIKFHTDILFTSKEELDKHPDRVEKFTHASMKGWYWAFTHIEDTAEYIYKNYNENNKSKKSLVYEGKELLKMATGIDILPPKITVKFLKDSLLGEITTESLKDISLKYQERKMITSIKPMIYFNDYIFMEWDKKLWLKVRSILPFILIIFLIFLIIFLLKYYFLNKKMQKQEEEKQQNYDLLIEADRKIKMETYIDHASHQLKSPLYNISSLVNILKIKHESHKLDDSTLTTKLIEIEKKSSIMKKTITFFLEYLSTDYKKENFSINETVEDTITYIDYFFKQNTINVKFNCKEKFEYFGSKIQLFQVLQSIFENAIQALALKKDNKLLIINIEEDNGDIIILISDNGQGIPSIYLPKIFNANFSTKKHSKAKGRGLHIAKIIIDEKFGGEISAYNKNGAVFKIVLKAQ